MSFGKNPYVPKAQTAEQKAADAPDSTARVRAYRDAAHQWDRAAERENPGKKRTEYEQNAERNRELADDAENGGDGGGDGGDGDHAPAAPQAAPKKPPLLN